MLKLGELRFIGMLRHWPRTESIETYLERAMPEFLSESSVRDSIAAVRILAILHREPALRSAWLMACHESEMQLVGIIADRASRAEDEFEVKLCAAAITAAMRLVDEDISSAVINDGLHVATDEATSRIAAAIRAASILPVCDPVA